MVETTSVREEKPKLSARDRLCLIQTINALPQTQFDELVFALDPPKGVIASNTAAQGTRSKDLLDWLEGSSGPGLAAADEVLQVLIPKATKTAPQPVAFVMMGRMGDLAPSELEAIAELLRQKTGDTSIALAFSTAGSIKLILTGSPEGLAKLQELFEAEELEGLNIPPVESVTPIDSNTQDARKARLIQALSLRGHSLAALVRVFDHSFNSFRDKVINLDVDLDVEVNVEVDVDPVQGIVSGRLSAGDLVKGIGLFSDSFSTRFSDSFNTSVRARFSARDLIRSIISTRDLVSGIVRGCDLRRSDLSGANLRHITLTGADLAGADLTYADVTGTIFRNNPGLTEADKRNLQSRGAIFLDPPSSDVPALVLR
jgi:uncharacterized protein YjbI with pentapeptide repeats